MVNGDIAVLLCFWRITLFDRSTEANFHHLCHMTVHLRDFVYLLVLDDLQATQSAETPEDPQPRDIDLKSVKEVVYVITPHISRYCYVFSENGTAVLSPYLRLMLSNLEKLEPCRILVVSAVKHLLFFSVSSLMHVFTSTCICLVYLSFKNILSSQNICMLRPQF